MHRKESILENEIHNILLDFGTEANHLNMARKLD